MGICEGTSYDMNEYIPEVLLPLVGLHSVSSLSASLLNVLVIVAICGNASLQTPSRILVCSMSFIDLCIGLVVQPVTIVFYVSAFNNWSEMFCVSWVMMTRVGYSMGITAILTLTAMSVDRYLAITTKAKYKTIVTKRRTTILALFLWIFASLSTISGLQFLPRREKFWVVFTVGFICLVTMVVSYVSSVLHLRKLSRTVSETSRIQPSRRRTSSYNINKYKRSLGTVLMILALNLIVYLPLLALSILTASTRVDNSVAAFQYVGFILSLSSTVNPIFYFWRMKELRDVLKTVLCCGPVDTE